MNRGIRLFLTGLTIFLLLVISATIVMANQDSSIVSLWHLDEGTGSTASDSVGDNDGFIFGATWIDDGIFGKALYFNGIDNYVELPPSNQIFDSDTFTINAWFQTSYNHPVYGSGEGRIVNIKRDTTATSSLSAVALYVEQDMIGLLYYTGSEHVWLKYATNYYNGEWHCMSVTHDSDTYRLYYDGDEVASQTDSFGDIGTDNAYLGTYNSTERFFLGNIDEVCIWDEALSPGEIASLAIPYTEMAKFSISHALINFSDTDDEDKVNVTGSLKLGDGNGVDITEDVTVTIGTFSEAIKMEEKGKRGDLWRYSRPGRYGGCIKEMSINWKNGRFMLKMDRADLSGMNDPNSVRISLIIGDDKGEVSIDMREKKKWLY